MKPNEFVHMIIDTERGERRNMIEIVYVVMYMDDTEPTCVVFDNEHAANACYEYLKQFHDWAGLDVTSVAKTFG